MGKRNLSGLTSGFPCICLLNVCVFLMFPSCVASQRTSHPSHTGPRSLLNQPDRCHPTMDLVLRKIRCAPVRVCCLNLHRRISRSLWKKTGNQWSKISLRTSRVYASLSFKTINIRSKQMSGPYWLSDHLTEDIDPCLSLLKSSFIS